MGIFKKSNNTADNKPLQDTLPEFVDSLLDQADLESIEESEPLMDLNSTHYVIDQAIELFRKLPKNNPELVVNVVKETLSSANVNLDQVIVDAQNKADSLQQQVAQLRSEIAEFKTQITWKENKIAESEAVLSEILSAKELLSKSYEKKTSPETNAGKSPVLHPSSVNNTLEQKDIIRKRSQIA